jgi:hypothetical protein
MREAWDYDRKKWLDKKGSRWHFAERWTWNSDAEFWYLDRTGDRSYDLYFRDDGRTLFGAIKFPRSRDNPYGFDKLKEKIMNDADFRKEYLDAESKRIWKRSWK